MDKQNRIAVTQLPAAVNDLLAAPFHFCVFALHGRKIQIFTATARSHRGCSTAAQPNQHCRTAKNDQLRTNRDILFEHVRLANVAESAGNHDRLVVATHFHEAGLIADCRFVGAKIATEIWTSILVIECRPADRSL